MAQTHVAKCLYSSTVLSTRSNCYLQCNGLSYVITISKWFELATCFTAIPTSLSSSKFLYTSCLFTFYRILLHTHIHTHTYTHTHTHVCTHMYTHTYTHVHTRTNTHMYTHTHTHAHTRTNTHEHIHTSTHTHPHTCQHMYVPTHILY